MIKDHFLKLLNWWRETVFIANKHAVPTFKEGEIWWCSVGINIGREIFGKGEKFSRPVIIFKKFGMDSFLGIPITSQTKEGTWYVAISYRDRVDRAILSQIRVFDSHRLLEKSATLNSNNFQKVREYFLKLYSS